MHNATYLPENPDYTLRDSARDSVRFAHRCLVPLEGGRWRALSSFVDTQGNVMGWHDFGHLEGPGWAANALGGAHILHAWGRFDHCHLLQSVALGLVDHVLDGGFLASDGFIAGYRHTQSRELCLNFKHNSDWFCPGSMARIALQMLWMADALPAGSPRAERLLAYAPLTAEWLLTHLPAGDWFPRRCSPDGRAYLHAAEGGEEPLAYASADGLYIVWLLLELTIRGMADHTDRVRSLMGTIMDRGGIFGSINHDTYDTDENVARAETFRLFRRAAAHFQDAGLRAFAHGPVLGGLERFLMAEDRNGVATRGLYYMEDTWDTAYLWENAEVAMALLEAYEDTGTQQLLCRAATVLRATAMHHYGELGFLTEGVDWNNHVGREHHIEGAEFGAIRYTEPLLNNLQHVEPVIRLLNLTSAQTDPECASPGRQDRSSASR